MRPAGVPEVLAGRYGVGELIGAGGMGDVHAGEDLRLGRPVAVKLLRPDLAEDPSVRRRFEAEAQAAARVVHPNVVAIFDTGEDAGIPFIVMERLPGRSLADAIRAAPLSPDAARRVGGQVLDALAAAHALGVIHRDIKPGNVLVADEETVKVADFGIAKLTESPTHTTTGVLVGTPSYVAPEQVAGAPATPATDLYAVGILLYEALAGRPPFSGQTPLALLQAIHDAEPEPLQRLRPDVDDALVAAIERALAKDPARRFPSAADMAAAVRGDGATGALRAPGTRTPSDTATQPAVAGPSTAVVAPPSPTPARPVRSSLGRNRRPLALIGATAALALAALLAFDDGGTSTAPEPPAPSLAPPVPTLPAQLERAIQRLEREVQP